MNLIKVTRCIPWSIFMDLVQKITNLIVTYTPAEYKEQCLNGAETPA
jgi:hypothetical protein